MNFVHKETLSESDWKMIQDGKGFALTDKEAEEMAFDILDKLGYNLDTLEKKKKTKYCPVCKSIAFSCCTSSINEWGDRSETFSVECSNKAECGLRTPDFWTQREAEEGWERICEKAKVQI